MKEKQIPGQITLDDKIEYDFNTERKTARFFSVFMTQNDHLGLREYENKLYGALKNVFHATGEYPVKEFGSFFVIFEINELFVFGSYGRYADLKSHFSKLENTATKKAYELPANVKLRHFTFFLIDVIKGNMILIHNKQTNNFNDSLISLMNENCFPLLIIPYKEKNIGKKFKTSGRISYIELETTNPEILKKNMTLIDASKRAKAKKREYKTPIAAKMKLTISFEQTGMDELAFIDHLNKKSKNYTDLKAHTADTTFDFIKEIIYKTVNIDIPPKNENHDIAIEKIKCRMLHLLFKNTTSEKNTKLSVFYLKTYKKDIKNGETSFNKGQDKEV